MNRKTKTTKCLYSGKATPCKGRRVAGEVVPGWSIRIPAHVAVRS